MKDFVNNIKFKEVFISVIGITPQVLTECLYYYSHTYYNSVRNFDKILVLTTSAGARLLKRDVIDSGQIPKIEKACSLPKGSINFSYDDIIEFHDKNGKTLEDIRDNQANSFAQDQLLNIFRELSTDKSTRISATVAGGRKTMGVYMALAFQLFGRSQDELFHILAPNEKMNIINTHQSDPIWYFPTDPTRVDEKLEVSILPVLKIGRYLDQNLNLSPGDLLLKIQQIINNNQPIQEIIVKKNLIYCEKERLRLKPKSASYLRFFINVRVSSICDIKCPGCEECTLSRDQLLEAAKYEILEEHLKISGKNSGHFQRTQESRLAKDRKGSFFLDISTINQDLSGLQKEIKTSKIGVRFKEAIMLKKFHFNSENMKDTWYGVIFDKEIVNHVK